MGIALSMRVIGRLEHLQIRREAVGMSVVMDPSGKRFERRFSGVIKDYASHI